MAGESGIEPLGINGHIDYSRPYCAYGDASFLFRQPHNYCTFTRLICITRIQGVQDDMVLVEG
jgi:hypothetical protein